MHPKLHSPHTPERLAAMYIAAQMRRHHSISMTRAVRALRAALHGSSVNSDDDLADILANAAVNAGVAVEFDRRGH